MFVIPPKRFIPQDSSAIEQPDSKTGLPKAVADTTGAPETNQNTDIVKDYQSGDTAQHEGSFGETNADHSTTGDPHVQDHHHDPKAFKNTENKDSRATGGSATIETEAAAAATDGETEAAAEKIKLAAAASAAVREANPALFAAFDAIDTDKDGFLDASELKVYMNDTLGQNLTDEQVDDIIKLHDEPPFDGKIDLVEFAKIAAPPG